MLILFMSPNSAPADRYGVSWRHRDRLSCVGWEIKTQLKLPELEFCRTFHVQSFVRALVVELL